jgi:hypothetical protein
MDGNKDKQHKPPEKTEKQLCPATAGHNPAIKKNCCGPGQLGFGLSENCCYLDGKSRFPDRMYLFRSRGRTPWPSHLRYVLFIHPNSIKNGS